MGSVKDVETLPGPRGMPDIGVFTFSDRYSVFDWGEMPDTIPGKGEALCTMGAYHFEELDDAGVSTHYLGVLDGEPDGYPDSPGDLSGLDEPPKRMVFELADVPELPFEDGEYNYDHFHDEAGERYVVPLEVIFRNVVGTGSSLRRRTEPDDHGLDMDDWPEEPLDLREKGLDPIVEFSTKYEEEDRYLDDGGELERISGRADLGDIEEAARKVNDILTERAEEAGFVHQDGKIEVVYDGGDIEVADVAGTFDENRYSYDGRPVSKEVIRQWYKENHSEWVEAVAVAKGEAEHRGEADWRELMGEVSRKGPDHFDVDGVDWFDGRPTRLPPGMAAAAANLYMAGTNAITGDRWFHVGSMKEAVERIDKIS